MREGKLTSWKPSELLYRLDMKAFKEKDAPFVGGRGAEPWNRWPNDKKPDTMVEKAGSTAKSGPPPPISETLADVTEGEIEPVM
eukprot:gene31790-40087_t